jgi:predicted nucleotidyltransferase
VTRTASASTSTRLSSEREQLEQLLAAVRDVLGPDLVGAYLFGSAVFGGLRRRSDLDVLVAARRRLARAETQRLVARLLAVSGRPRPVELTIVVQSEVKPWRYPPRMELQYGEWLRGDFERGNVEPSQTTNPDLASLVTMVLLADRPLFGPPPAVVLDPVPAADLTLAMDEAIDEVLQGIELASDTRNGVLTLARIWSTGATGVIRSKDAAADWALERLPEEHRAVLAHARAVYLGDEEERWDDLAPRVRPHADYVVREIRQTPGLRAGVSEAT